MKIIVCLSGGLDSAVLLGHLRHMHPDAELVALSVDYGQRHVRELTHVRTLAGIYDAALELVDLSGLRPILAGSSQTSDEIAVPHGHYTDPVQRQTVIPNRNLLLLSVAGACALSKGARAVAYAAHAGDAAIYPDCRPAFVEAATVVFQRIAFEPVELLTPFLSWSKAKVCQYGANLGVPLVLTYSCYEGQEQHCGQCGACVERREAFRIAGVNDPTTYREESPAHV